MENFPQIFRPTMIQDAESMQWESWYLLRRWEFTHEEKTFLCEEICQVSSYLELEPCTAVAIAARFGLKRSTISRWMANYRKGKIQHPRSGCPPCLDQEAESDITKIIVDARQRNQPFNEFQLNTLLGEEAQLVGRKRKAGAYSRKEYLCANTIKKYLKKLMVIIQLNSINIAKLLNLFINSC